MNNFDSQMQDSLKRRWQERALTLTSMEANQNHPSTSSSFHTKLLGAGASAPPSLPPIANPSNNKLLGFPRLDDDLASTVVPSITVVLEGRSICHRINLHKHSGYQSLAKALRTMFVDGDAEVTASDQKELNLSNAIPGHIIAYEDMENDLLLVGDLNWKDFVRVAKRIRILPVKSNSKKGRGGV